jgi:hypothetical protein
MKRHTGTPPDSRQIRMIVRSGSMHKHTDGEPSANWVTVTPAQRKGSDNRARTRR